ncbi:MAG: M56 family metallopeptidase [Limisphaerales bacterium]
MNASFHSFFSWLLRSSWQAAVLTILVLLAQFCLGKRLDGRWRHLLWFMVLARLVLPWTPPSPASLYNYVRFEPALVVRQAGHPPSAPAVAEAPPATSVSRPITARPEAQPRVPAPHKPRWLLPDWPVVLAWVWGTGAAVLAARVILQNILFRRQLRSASATTEQPTLRLFEECQTAISFSSRVELRETRLIESPALYGLFRLRLLLPPKLSERFTPSELRHIFLHELGHVRRHDMEVQWLMTCLQIVHWFNPVLWFGFRRMAADREVACDELALVAVGENDGTSYGQTIIKLLEASSGTPALSGLVGILEDKGQIFRRVAMIAAFKKTPRWSFAGLAVAVVLGLATLTGAQTGGTRGIDLLQQSYDQLHAASSFVCDVTDNIKRQATPYFHRTLADGTQELASVISTNPLRVAIENRQGCWIVSKDEAIKINSRESHQPIRAVLDLASNYPAEVTVKIERQMEDGVDCRVIEAVSSDRLTRQLADAFRAEHKGSWALSQDPKMDMLQFVAKRRLFWIGAADQVLYRYKEYDGNGDLLTDVSLSDQRWNETLPDDVFAVPKNLEVFTPEEFQKHQADPRRKNPVSFWHFGDDKGDSSKESQSQTDNPWQRKDQYVH